MPLQIEQHNIILFSLSSEYCSWPLLRYYIFWMVRNRLHDYFLYPRIRSHCISSRSGIDVIFSLQRWIDSNKYYFAMSMHFFPSHPSILKPFQAFILGESTLYS